MSEPAPLFPPLKPKQVDARLWRDGAFTADDWQTVADDAAVPASGRIVVSLARWRQDASLRAPKGDRHLGLRLAVGDSIDFAADNVERLGLIVLPFPKFSDGRSHSTARRLREAGFTGDIRATGDVLLDQLPLLLRTGFVSFEIVDAATIKALERGDIPLIPEIYQRGAAVAKNATRFSLRPTLANVGRRA